MADDIANLLHSSYGLPKTGKSAPMGSAKKSAPQGQTGPARTKSGGPPNSSPIVDDGFGNGSMGSKSPSDYSMGDDPFLSGSGRAAPGAYAGGDDIFGMGVGGGSAHYTSSSSADPFMMGGSYSPGPKVGSSDPFGGLGQMGASSQRTYESSDDFLGSSFAGKPSPAQQPSASNGHGASAGGAFDDFGFGRTSSGGSGRFGSGRDSPAANHTPREPSPQPSPRAGTFFGRSKKEEKPAETKRGATNNIPGEDAWLTVEDLLLSLVTQPTSAPPPSRPPPPPGTQRPRQPPPPPYHNVAQNPPSSQARSQQQPAAAAAASSQVPRDVPPAYAYTQQAPQSWPPPGNRRPSSQQPESQPPPARQSGAAAAAGVKEADGMDGFDAFASGRGARGSVTPPSEPDRRSQDAEANAAAQAAASSSSAMAEAMARAKEKAERAAKAKANKEREEARRAREEAAERLKRETQAKTQRAAETGFNNNDFFNATPRRPESEPRQRMPHSDFMSDPPRPSSGFSNLDDLGGVGVRKPAAAAATQQPTRPAATPSTAATANDWADILGGGGGGAGSAPSDVFQEIEGETAERRDLRYQKWANINQRATEALAEKNRRDMEAQREQNERSRADDLYSHEIKRWASGKEGNLIALISTLQHVLWPECGWEPVGLTDLITPPQVKKAYRKATLCVHPDKVQQKGANIHQKYIAEKVFDLLKEAWNKYNANTLF